MLGIQHSFRQIFPPVVHALCGSAPVCFLSHPILLPVPPYDQLLQKSFWLFFATNARLFPGLVFLTNGKYVSIQIAYPRGQKTAGWFFLTTSSFESIPYLDAGNPEAFSHDMEGAK